MNIWENGSSYSLKPETLNQIALIFTKFKPDNRIKALVKVCRTKSLPSSILAFVLYPFSLLVLQLQFEPHRQEIIPERNNWHEVLNQNKQMTTGYINNQSFTNHKLLDWLVRWLVILSENEDFSLTCLPNWKCRPTSHWLETQIQNSGPNNK